MLGAVLHPETLAQRSRLSLPGLQSLHASGVNLLLRFEQRDNLIKSFVPPGPGSRGQVDCRGNVQARSPLNQPLDYLGMAFPRGRLEWRLPRVKEESPVLVWVLTVIPRSTRAWLVLSICV